MPWKMLARSHTDPITHSVSRVCSEHVCVHQEQLKGIYQAQIESLEAQVLSLRSVYSSCEASVDCLLKINQTQTLLVSSFASGLRKDLSVSQKECEEVKDRLRHREKHAADALKADGAPRVAGLCLQCAQHEAVLAGTHTNLHVQAINRLQKSVLLHKYKRVSSSHSVALSKR